MKKLLFFSLILLIHSGIAQTPCFPDLNPTQPGYYPDSITNLPPATVGIPYEEIITVVVPTDTLIPQVGNVPIDSVKVDSIIGLPCGFNWGCHNTNCITHGGSRGCTVIWGMPCYSEIGDNYLDIYVTLYGRLFGTIAIAYHTVIKAYKITINGSLPCLPDLNVTTLWFNPQVDGNKDTAFVDSLFSEIFTVNVPATITNSGNTVSIDSLVFTAVEGLPASIAPYFTNNIMQIPGNQKACLLLEGVPTNAEIGTYPVTFKANIYGKENANSVSFPYNFSGYQILILANTAISETSVNKDGITVFPNPFSNYLTIQLPSNYENEIYLRIFDITGRNILNKVCENHSQPIIIPFEKQSKGLYFLQISDSKNLTTLKVIHE